MALGETHSSHAPQACGAVDNTTETVKQKVWAWWAEACDMSGYNLGWWGSELPGPHSSQGILAQTAATATQMQRPGQHPTDTQREWVLRRPQWKPKPVPRSLFCGPYRHVQPAGPCIQSPPCPPSSLELRLCQVSPGLGERLRCPSLQVLHAAVPVSFKRSRRDWGLMHATR